MWDNPGRGVQVEEVYIYTVAYAPSEHNDLALRSIARAIGQEAGQDAMYIQYAGGAVEIVSVFPVSQPSNDNYAGVLPAEIHHDPSDFHSLI